MVIAKPQFLSDIEALIAFHSSAYHISLTIMISYVKFTKVGELPINLKLGGRGASESPTYLPPPTTSYAYVFISAVVAVLDY